MKNTVPPLSEQPRDEHGYLEPTYRVPMGYAWTSQTGTVRVNDTPHYLRMQCTPLTRQDIQAVGAPQAVVDTFFGAALPPDAPSEPQAD